MDTYKALSISIKCKQTRENLLHWMEAVLETINSKLVIFIYLLCNSIKLIHTQ